MMENLQNQKFSILPLRDVDFGQMLHEVEANFITDDKISRVLNLDQGNLDQFLNPIFKQCCRYDYSLGYLNEKGETISVVTSLPYTEFRWFEENLQCSSKLKPLDDLLATLDTLYVPEDFSKTVESFIWSTNKEYAGKGLLSKMLKHSIHKIKEEGFKMVIADCKSKISQRVAKKEGFEVKAEIFYKNFISDGKMPFSDFEEDESIARMVKYL